MPHVRTLHGEVSVRYHQPFSTLVKAHNQLVKIDPTVRRAQQRKPTTLVPVHGVVELECVPVDRVGVVRMHGGDRLPRRHVLLWPDWVGV